MADSTLFYFIYFGFRQWCIATSTLGIAYIIFAWVLCCGCILKLTGSLLAGELSYCDCVEIKVSRGNVPFHPLGSNYYHSESSDPTA